MSRLDPVLLGLASSDEIEREDARLALDELEPLDAAEAELALQAAVAERPAGADWEDTATDLVLAAISAASAESIPVVEEVYARLPTAMSRSVALRLLADLRTRAASEALARLLAQPPDPGEELELIWATSEPRDADLLVPVLLERFAGTTPRHCTFEVVVRLSARETIADAELDRLADLALEERALLDEEDATEDWVAHERRTHAVTALVDRLRELGRAGRFPREASDLDPREEHFSRRGLFDHLRRAVDRR